MRIKHRPIVKTTHQQDGLTQQLMDDPVYLMDDPSAIMGGPTSLDVTQPFKAKVKVKSRVK